AEIGLKIKQLVVRKGGVVIEDDAEGKLFCKLVVGLRAEQIVVEDGLAGREACWRGAFAIGEAIVDGGFVHAKAGGRADGEAQGDTLGVGEKRAERRGGEIVFAGAAGEAASEREPLVESGSAVDGTAVLAEGNV